MAYSNNVIESMLSIDKRMPTDYSQYLKDKLCSSHFIYLVLKMKYIKLLDFF